VAGTFGRTGRLRIAYADPCHLAHGQGIREAPRRLLGAIPDADVVPLRDAARCCGSAGAWSLGQPEMSLDLLAAKVATVRDAAPHVLATANPGCHLQIEAGLRAAGLRVPVAHVADLVARALPAPHGVAAT
jgi:glycolate oxidase iron-sulfur subunit